MSFNIVHHQRRSIRLKDYDYSGFGVYFVTLCTAGRKCLFGEIRNGEMAFTTCGELVRAEWLASARIRQEIALDAFVVMPNHLHGIVAIVGVGADAVRPAPPAKRLGPRPRSLSTLISGFKAATTRRINALHGTVGVLVWQRNYFDRIVRNEQECEAIREYIIHNPRRWELDRENPGA